MKARQRGKHHTITPDHHEGPPAIQRIVIATSDGEIIRDPMVAKTEWRDPDDLRPGNREGARKIGGWKKVWTIDTLHKTSPDQITKPIVAAATRLLDDMQTRAGVRGAGELRNRVDGAAGSAIAVEDVKLRAGDRVEAAWAAIGYQNRMLLEAVVVENWTLTKLSANFHVKNRDRVFGLVLGALTMLREHYDGPASTRKEI